MEKWNEVKLVPEFSEQGVDCYRLAGGDYENEYYVVSEAETRKLLNTPEVVGYEVYHCLIPSTSQMLYYFKEQGKVTAANILSILRGALNYPLEESCYREHIRVHDISFLSSERVFKEEEIAGLEIKYSKLTMVPGSTLLIGDIIATGETLIHCLRYVTDFYREHGASLRNIIIFTIGGTTGIKILERLTKEIREFWPEFEGFITVYYEGIFSTYQDKGVSGINLPDVDFYWKDGIIAPEFRRETLSMRDPLFEKSSSTMAVQDAMKSMSMSRRFSISGIKCWRRPTGSTSPDCSRRSSAARLTHPTKSGFTSITTKKSMNVWPNGCTARKKAILQALAMLP